MKEKIISKKFGFSKYRVSLRDFIEHPFFSGSAVMIIGSNATNLVAYLYHVVIGRMLGPSAYGNLVAILSIIGLVTVSFTFLGLVIIKFISSEEYDKSVLFLWFYRNAYRLGLIFAVFTLIASPLIANFLSINLSVVLLLSPMFFSSALLLFYRSYLQGTLRFRSFVASTNMELWLRLFLGALFVALGLSVFGAVLGIVLGSILALFYLRIKFKDLHLQRSLTSHPTGKILKYTIPVFITTFAGFSLVTSDVILVKHFFPSHEAGIYGSLSNLGKIIFYGTAPVSAVMFPLVSKKYAKGEKYQKIILLSLLMTFLIAGGVTLAYHLYPDLMILVLYGKDFLQAAKYLSTFGIFMTIYALCSLLVSFYLSKERTNIAYFTVTAAVLQVVGITFFHDSIFSVIRVSIIISVALFIGLMGYFLYETKKTRS